MMTSRIIAIALPGVLIICLMIWQFVTADIKERRGRALFMRETGGTKADWDALGYNSRRQRKWSDADREDRELEKMAKDLIERKDK